jgi:hypothetical protein
MILVRKIGLQDSTYKESRCKTTIPSQFRPIGAPCEELHRPVHDAWPKWWHHNAVGSCHSSRVMMLSQR